MKNVIIYSSHEDWVEPFVQSPDGFQIRLTSEPAFSGTADCVLISQQYAGNQLAGAIAQYNQLRIPCAVVTFDGTLENQEKLLQCGADDVIVLPVCTEILCHRIRALTEMPVRSDTALNFASFDRIVESNQGNGSFIVAEHDFMNIYRFVTRILERLEQRAQLIIFSFSSEPDSFVESESVLHFLKIVQTCMRRGDISSVYGKQVLVLLLGSDAEGGQGVIDRVISTFNTHYNMDESCEVTYEMREITKAASK